MSNLPTTPPSNEIPAARRESAEVSLAEVDNIQPQPKSSGKGTWLILTVLGLLGLGAVGFWQRERILPYVATAAISAKTIVTRWQDNIGETLDRKRADQSDQETSQNSSAAAAASARQSAIDQTAASEPEQLLNHRRYNVADTRKLVPLSPNSEVLVQPDAQAKLEAMLADAKASGVRLGVISGFRTIEDQNYLYFDLKAERGESARARAEVSAPPGYSEHHTGYAVDFIDESQPATFLEESFENTPAFKWLVANAPFYNFELSFPKDNPASVAYEPWHWRYVGNQESLELFYK